jgi:HD-GYP domain-containing protein (c-di-GMP phosphodiesterase class II)
MIAELPGLDPVAELVLAHHERIDGGGYPHRLVGDEIPLPARAISVADCFDAMTARDSYRAPLPADRAADELRRVAGTQLDGDLVAEFVALLAAGAPSDADAAESPRRLGVRGRTADEAPAAPQPASSGSGKGSENGSREALRAYIA